MPHPVCGKCNSAAVYRDEGNIACMMCGNRYPGAGPGFYMSDKGRNDGQSGKIEKGSIAGNKAKDEILSDIIAIVCMKNPGMSEDMVEMIFKTFGRRKRP